MGKVAVAGGSSGLGRTMVDALEVAETHDYIVLSRKATGPETRAVDYYDIDVLTSLLESEQVDTVISMLPIDSDDSGQAQLNLIEAADRSKCTKRFLPSEFGMVYTKDNIAHVPSYHWKLKAVDALEKTNLEFSLVSIGLFLDYWAAPRIPTHIRAANILIDPENNAAVIPGDGNTPATFTHSTDAAKHTVALLDIPNWKRRYTITPNRMTLNEAVKLAEEVKGVKFDVKYFSVEQLKKGENDLTPSMKKALPEEMHGGMKAMLALSGIGMATGSNDIQGIDDLVGKFPNIKPVTVRDVWEAWK
ncbi:SDR family [Fusarium tjaetaba]|uniref:SDR family n=1 Tax=Fusarium tjaetaba TaxID=1567544 RepID=A0A8H5S9A0_9HYPO|nr:SDR family [Fusarium tjaetaba]KAF5647667.1 SDR family [Fusarium tjaetaba]